MFGTLRPHACSLGPERRRAYERYYCGLCKGLGDGFGTMSRALVSYDAVFVALLVDALLEQAAQPSSCRCPLLPLIHRPTVRPDSVAVEFASSVQILLADQWLADRASDGRRLARLGRPLLTGRVARARATLARLGVPLVELDGFERVQEQVEASGSADPLQAAEPTACALALVFRGVASLPGAEPLRASEPRQKLGELGSALGRLIYLIDALEDLARDRARGSYNPCLAYDGRGRPRIAASRVERCARAADQALSAVRGVVAALPWKRNRDLVESIVCERMFRTLRAAKGAARRTTAEPKTGVPTMLWLPMRLARIAALAFAFVWVWLVAAGTALAKGGKPKHAPNDALDAGADADASAADAGATTDGSAPSIGTAPPALPPLPPSSAQPSPTTSPGNDVGDAPDRGAASAASGESDHPGPAQPLDCKACGTCGKDCWHGCCFGPCVEHKCDGCGCQDCCKPCGDCCKPCGDCCNGCGNCGGCCK